MITQNAMKSYLIYSSVQCGKIFGAKRLGGETRGNPFILTGLIPVREP